MNIFHHWRMRSVPATQAYCVLCRLFTASTSGEKDEAAKQLPELCRWFDHDLRGHVCNECAELVGQAERVLVQEAGCTAPTNSMLEGPSAL